MLPQMLQVDLVALFHQMSCRGEIGEGLIQLNGGELRVISRVHALVAEDGHFHMRGSSPPTIERLRYSSVSMRSTMSMFRLL